MASPQCVRLICTLVCLLTVLFACVFKRACAVCGSSSCALVVPAHVLEHVRCVFSSVGTYACPARSHLSRGPVLTEEKQGYRKCFCHNMTKTHLFYPHPTLRAPDESGVGV